MKPSPLHRRLPGWCQPTVGFSSRITKHSSLGPSRWLLALVGGLCILAQAGWAATCSYSLNLPAGFSLIANQCDHLGGNTLNAVFPAVPDGSQIIKWNCQSQSYEQTPTFANGAWSPNLTLDPGEGAYFINPGPTMTVTISGDAHTPILPLNVPVNGCCMVSRQESLAGGFDEIVGLGPGENDNVFLFNPLTSSWAVYNYSDDNPGWSPSDPVANVGESFWYCRGGAIPAAPCDPVRITQPPDSMTNCASFSVVAAGSGPFGYQWYVNNAIIAGATASSYTLCSVSLADNGNQYTVQIINACGSVTSQVATLTVTRDPTGPVVTCPTNLTVQCDGDAPAPNPAAVRVTDYCGPAPVVTHVGDVVSGTCPKTIVRTYKATDVCGNVGMCTQTITVHDTMPPVFGCASPLPNLVPNPGFENYSACPSSASQICSAAPWFQPTTDGTSDFFHTCALPNIPAVFAGVPDNLYGSQVPHSGQGYAGARK